MEDRSDVTALQAMIETFMGVEEDRAHTHTWHRAVHLSQLSLTMADGVMCGEVLGLIAAPTTEIQVNCPLTSACGLCTALPPSGPKPAPCTDSVDSAYEAVVLEPSVLTGTITWSICKMNCRA